MPGLKAQYKLILEMGVVNRSMKNLNYSFNVLTSVTTVLIVTGCSDGATFNDFRARAEALAGDRATDCGHASIGEGSEQNICVGTAFSARQAAFATYEQQGIDSRVVSGLSVATDRRVFILSFDGDPTGAGSSSNGEIFVDSCNNPRLSGLIDGQSFEVFNCE